MMYCSHLRTMWINQKRKNLPKVNMEQIYAPIEVKEKKLRLKRRDNLTIARPCVIRWPKTLNKWNCMCETLQDCIKKASVAQICKPCTLQICNMKILRRKKLVKPSKINRNWFLNRVWYYAIFYSYQGLLKSSIYNYVVNEILTKNSCSDLNSSMVWVSVRT